MLNNVSLKNAPLLLRWARTFEMLLFILPVAVLFYQYKGLTVGDFFLFQGIFSISKFLFEIPSGYLGDVFSRKKIIILSFLAILCAFITYYFFSGFYWMFLAEIFFGVSMSLYSGTGEAYLYDVLKKQGREKDFIKEEAKIKSWTIFGTAFATFTGGAIYQYWGADTMILIETFFVLIGFILTMFLPDIPEVKRVVEKGKSKFKDILDIVKYTIKHAEIKWLILYPAVFGAGTKVLLWAMQPLMKSAEIPVVLFGVFLGLNQIFRGTLAHFSHYIFQKLKTNKLSILLFLLLVIGTASAILIPSLNEKVYIYVLLIVMAFAISSQVVLGIVTRSMMNHRIKSDERATVLSVSSMFNSAFSGVSMIALKFLIDGTTLQNTFIVIGLVILVLTVYPLKKLLRLKI
ncbi:MAG: MFS transporter [Alphaproteobacteria bacterium]|nr:MAG: hypothetical protein B6I23_02975 [Rickettsiaceae bacterium 4572_127]